MSLISIKITYAWRLQQFLHDISFILSITVIFSSLTLVAATAETLATWPGFSLSRVGCRWVGQVNSES